MFYERGISGTISKSLKNNPVVFVNGARQVGKSTLIEELIKNGYSANYLSLDDHAVLFASSNDPFGFLDKYEGPLAIDEVQRNPDLLIAVKKIVDCRKQNGQFLMTGSANVLTIPNISESLAGRMILHTLWPLSQGEIVGCCGNFIEWAFNCDKLPFIKTKLSQVELIDMIVRGGYPRSVRASDDADRAEWMRSYIDTILQRDILNLSKIEGIKELPHVLAIIAERIGNLINLADISRITNINKVTLKRYYTLLQMVFLVVEVPAWFSSREKRLAKAPKVYLNDTGLACYLKHISHNDFINNRTNIGQLLENFCLMELKKQSTWHHIKPDIYHYRTQAGSEVDIVLEGPNNSIVGIEVKASTTIKKTDLSGIKSLQAASDNKFVKGIILYTGTQPIYIDTNIYALPINSLWEI